MKSEKTRRQDNKELYRLSEGFKALNIDHKRRVVKTAQVLLRVQRTHKEVIAAGKEKLPAPL